jgi:ribosome recycling factor
MPEGVEQIKSETEASMKKAIAHMESEMGKIRAGKANPNMLDGITVDYYGAPVPVAQVANVVVLDARTISVQPWEKNMLQPIERAIIASNIGINPQNDGVNIRLFMPPLTEERRKEMVKKCNVEGENGKISIRNIRRDAVEQVKKLQKDGLSEDISKNAEAAIQDITNRYITLVEKHLEAKEKEIMAV